MPQLAYAYLALADDDQAAPQRTLPRVMAGAAGAGGAGLGARPAAMIQSRRL
jgi:hypothetical protein